MVCKVSIDARCLHSADEAIPRRKNRTLSDEESGGGSGGVAACFFGAPGVGRLSINGCDAEARAGDAADRQSG
jgi:hypothetical protein